MASVLTSRPVSDATETPPSVATQARLPTLVGRLVNRFLRDLPGVQATVEHVRIHPWHGGISASGVTLVEASLAQTVSVRIERLTVHFTSKALFRRQLVADVVIDQPDVKFVIHSPSAPTPPPVPRRRATDLTWRDAVRRAVGFKINRVVLRHGRLTVRYPAFLHGPIEAQNIYALASNLTNRETLSETMKAVLTMEGEILSSGRFHLHVEGFPLAKSPTFDADAQLNGLDLAALHDVFGNSFPLELRSGTLGLYAEAAAAQGDIKGYVKPIIDRLDIVPRPNGFVGLVQTKLLRLATRLLKNSRHDRIATRIPFSGRLDDVRLEIASTIYAFLRNAFSEALKARLDRSVFFTQEGDRAENTAIERLPAPSRFSRFVFLLKETFKHWNADEAPRMAAALSYYMTFSVAPLLLLTIAIVGLVFGKDAATGEVFTQLQGWIGPPAAKALEAMIQSASQPSSGITATLLSMVTLFFGASGVLNELKRALNKMWQVPGKSGFGALIKDRLLSFAIVLCVGLFAAPRRAART